MKTKALINFAVTSKLICVFVFTYADMQIVGFLMRWLIKYKSLLNEIQVNLIIMLSLGSLEVNRVILRLLTIDIL